MIQERRRSREQIHEEKMANARTAKTTSISTVPALLQGEDRAAYEKLLTDVTAALSPADVIEELWVYDVADCGWEILRLRRLKADLIAANLHHGVEEVVKPLIRGEGLDLYPESKLASDWRARKPEAMEQVDSLLKSSEQGMEAVVAQTFAIELEQIERIERMIMHAEVRRNAALRELDRHREALARKLKIEQIEDAEFTEVPGQEVMDEAKDRAA
jgi:hypothetical protein